MQKYFLIDINIIIISFNIKKYFFFFFYNNIINLTEFSKRNCRIYVRVCTLYNINILVYRYRLPIVPSIILNSIVLKKNRFVLNTICTLYPHGTCIQQSALENTHISFFQLPTVQHTRSNFLWSFVQCNSVILRITFYCRVY